MMIDWGIPEAQQADIIAAQGHLIDKAKIAAGIPRFMPVDLLKRKLAAYRAAGISTANGGLFTELTLKQGTYDEMLSEMTDDEIMADVETYLNAGASSVYLEAAEIFDGETAREALIRKLSNTFPAEALIFELPVNILPGITDAMKHKMASKMVSTLGTEVNLANVEHYEVYLLECLRRGLGGDTNHPGGAFRLAGIGD